MKTAIGSLTLALTLIVTPAATQSTSAAAVAGERIVPPPEYDHPFAGELTVFTARNQDEVRAACPRTQFPRWGHSAARPTSDRGGAISFWPPTPTSSRLGFRLS